MNTAARRFSLAAACFGAALLLGSCSTGASRTDSGIPESTGYPAPLLQKLALLEARAMRIQDINDIKRLQRAYGYYLDEGQWDDVADLFADDASVEIGFDGVYRGREHIRQYFKTLGGGHNGLAPGQLNEHLQLMPVITPGTDGVTAKGTWRAVILSGRLGKDAFWTEGPYENEYIKQDGVWKISKVHWFQTLHVPYEGGWARTADTNGGRFVGDRLKPDAPPTLQYKTWPGAATPPFHFRGSYPGLEPLDATKTSLGDTAPEAVAMRLARLSGDVIKLDAQDRVENLQRIYGFYTDKGLWSEAADLLTKDAELEIQGRGVFKGRARILEYLRAIGPEGLQSGRLFDNMQLQPVTHVDDRLRAQSRWHVFSQLALHGQFHEWGSGVLENEYAVEDGNWHIRRMHFYPTMYTPYEAGWGKVSLPASRFEPTLQPDRASVGASSTYDHAFVTPYHYAHPVRGAVAHSSGVAQPAIVMPPHVDMTMPAHVLDSTLTILDRRMTAIEDRASIENLQTAYGYYLATLLWDDLAALFAEDGTIEIAQRGVYVGRAAVRRNLNLYGQAGLDDGVLHNHMQYQMVIDVADDGTTAKLRSRALSMMGNFGRNATWMGGTYENEFVKINGRWMFHKDQQINTYFTPYETGWKDLPQRPAPGINAANPPDRPPSFPFDMYPKNFLPPFHYVNPVTGKAYVAPAP